ncbi:hypothetical protein CRYUN_Cryun29cG0011900 [Craigia yunnanensis]
MEVESVKSKNGKSMEQPGSSAASVLKRRRKCRNFCFGVMGVLIFIIILIVILASTIFKAKRPVTTIDSVSLSNLRFSVLQVSLNASLDVDLSIKNPNKVGFKYTDSSAQLNYRGQQVGEVPIPAGKISADETVPMNLTLTIMADRLISDSKFISDVLGGELPLNTFAKISGKVNVLNLLKIHVVSSTSCDFTVFLSNSSVGDQDCKYKTKLCKLYLHAAAAIRLLSNYTVVLDPQSIKIRFSGVLINRVLCGEVYYECALDPSKLTTASASGDSSRSTSHSTDYYMLDFFSRYSSASRVMRWLLGILSLIVT